MAGPGESLTQTSAEVRPKPARDVHGQTARTFDTEWDDKPNTSEDAEPLDKSVVESKWKRYRTYGLLNLAFIIEKADEQCLPNAYTYIGASFDATLTQLGLLALARGLVQAGTSPFAGLLGDRVSRVWLVAAGAMLWAIMTMGIGLSRHLYQAMIFCAFNGIGLALVLPNTQSLIADFFPGVSHGRAFGFLFFVSNLGGLAGGYFATSFGGNPGYNGYEGWRLVFFVIAAVSALLSLLLLLFASDPRKKAARGLVGAKPGNWVVQELRSMWRDVGLVLRVPTFIIIVCQGLVGSMPWVAIGFMATYLLSIGFSAHNAALLVALFTFGKACGSWGGGFIADMASKFSPRYARIWVAQISVALTYPYSLILFLVLPTESPQGMDSKLAYYAVTMAIGGALISWNTAINSAIFAEIVPEQLRSSVYAFDRSFEGAMGTLGGPLVGVIAERVFGYQGTLGAHGAQSEGLRHANALALGKGILTISLVPWGICLCLYTGLYFTLPRDRERSAALTRQLALEASRCPIGGSQPPRGPSLGALGSKKRSHVELEKDAKALA